MISEKDDRLGKAPGPGSQLREATFGGYIRSLRLARGLSMRRFAGQVNMSLTYLSRVERDLLPPPAEEKVLALAAALGEHPDALLARAGRVASDLPGIIRAYPVELAGLLRMLEGLPAHRVTDLCRQTMRGWQEAMRNEGRAVAVEIDSGSSPLAGAVSEKPHGSRKA